MVPLTLVNNITTFGFFLEAFMLLNIGERAKNRDKMVIFVICCATVTQISESTPKLSEVKIEVFSNRMTPY